MIVTTTQGTRMLPLSRASLVQVYSLYPSLGLLKRVVFNEGIVVLKDIWNDVRGSVGGTLVLAKDEKPITTDMPLLTS